MIIDLAKIQKKQNKVKSKRSNRPRTKIINILPPQTQVSNISSNTQNKSAYDLHMEQIARSMFK